MKRLFPLLIVLGTLLFVLPASSAGDNDAVQLSGTWEWKVPALPLHGFDPLLEYRHLYVTFKEDGAVVVHDFFGRHYFERVGAYNAFGKWMRIKFDEMDDWLVARYTKTDTSMELVELDSASWDAYDGRIVLVKPEHEPLFESGTHAVPRFSGGRLEVSVDGRARGCDFTAADLPELFPDEYEGDIGVGNPCPDLLSTFVQVIQVGPASDRAGSYRMVLGIQVSPDSNDLYWTRPFVPLVGNAIETLAFARNDRRAVRVKFSLWP